METREQKRQRIESRSYLEKIFHLDPKTGALTWKVQFPGRRAGTLMACGYRKVSLERLDFKEHRLVWVMTHGAPPPPGIAIDHINRKRDDNRPENLRLATASLNVANTARRKSNTTGLKGAYKHSQLKGKFYSNICVNRKSIYLGLFDTAEAAHQAYMEAAKKYFGQFASC